MCPLSTLANRASLIRPTRATFRSERQTPTRTRGARATASSLIRPTRTTFQSERQTPTRTRGARAAAGKQLSKLSGPLPQSEAQPGPGTSKAISPVEVRPGVPCAGLARFKRQPIQLSLGDLDRVSPSGLDPRCPLETAAQQLLSPIDRAGNPDLGCLSRLVEGSRQTAPLAVRHDHGTDRTIRMRLRLSRPPLVRWPNTSTVSV